MLRISVFFGYMCFCNSYVVQNGFWAVFVVKSRAICILCHIACAVLLSLCHKPCLIYVKSWQKLRAVNLVKKSRINAVNTCNISVQNVACTDIQTDIVAVILCGCEIWCVTSREEHTLRVCKAGWWGEYLVWEGVGIEGFRRLCSEIHDCYSPPDIIIIIIARKITHMWHVACI